MHQSGNEYLRPRLGYFLLSQTQFLDKRTVTGDILGSEVFQQVSSLTNHTEKTAVAVEVLLVDLQMLGQGVDTVGQNGYLYLGRTGITLVRLVLVNDLLLDFLLHFLFTFLKNFERRILSKRQVMRRMAPWARQISASREKAEHFDYTTTFLICKEEK